MNTPFGLLEPLVLKPRSDHEASWEEHLERLSEFGFEIEPFGGSSYLVRRVPALLQGNDLSGTVADIVEEAGRKSGIPSWEDAVMINMACHAAIQSGQTLSMDQMRELVRQLEETRVPRTCPHGRPTMLHVSAEQLQREFGRR